VAAETGATKLADFGIAKAAEQTRITQVGSVLGTAAYLSPEQAHGDEAGPASDTYSLGVCAYQFLTGRLPHEYASLTELALKQQQDAVVPITEYRPEVPRELDEAVRLSLERDPGARYASALEFARAIDAGLHGERTAATERLALADDEATRAMEATSATRAMPRTGYAPPAEQPAPARTAAPAAARPRPDERAARRARARRRWGTLLALLAVLAAIAAVGVAVLSSDDGGGATPVNQDRVEDQIQGLRDFIQRHTP
jgi:eukaryotic-like serine/threonine-protein kinase